MRVIVTGLALLLMTAPAAAQSESSSPPTTTITIDYREPTTKSDGTPLQALKSIRLYWQVDGGPETVVTLPASSKQGRPGPPPHLQGPGHQRPAVRHADGHRYPWQRERADRAADEDDRAIGRQGVR